MATGGVDDIKAKRTPEEQRAYWRAKSAAWRAKNPERVRERNARSREEQKRKYQQNPEYYRAKRREWWWTSPGLRERQQDLKLKKSYGISREEFLRRVKRQRFCCAICRGTVTIDGSRGMHMAHVDHCHETKKVRGILCGRCNMALGQFMDDHELLRRAIRYLRLNGARR